MGAWPNSMTVAPIREWPGELTPHTARRVAVFRAGLTDTVKLLDREIYHLAETRAHQNSAELLVAIPAGAFRRDGRPRADARVEHPGVVFSMESRVGRLSYPCDTFTEWQDNLRAIALALEALRKVDRYGVTRRGEQYRGFLAVEARPASAFTSDYAAWQFIKQVAGYDEDETPTPRLIRDAKRRSHPDTGGNADTFQRVVLAAQYLTQNGYTS